jgi:hypothetical protein
MKIPYTWYRRRHETHYYHGRLVISRLIMWSWIIAIGVGIYAGLSALDDADASFYAGKHFESAEWTAIGCFVAAGAIHLVLSLIGAYFDHADRKRPLPPAPADGDPAVPPNNLHINPGPASGDQGAGSHG